MACGNPSSYNKPGPGSNARRRYRLDRRTIFKAFAASGTVAVARSPHGIELRGNRTIIDRYWQCHSLAGPIANLSLGSGKSLQDNAFANCVLPLSHVPNKAQCLDVVLMLYPIQK